MDVATMEWDLWSTTARLVVTRPETLAPAKSIADAILSDVDRAASRFRPDSELLNLRRDDSGTVQLSPTLASLMRKALHAAELSEGRVDPTVGGLLGDLGYDRDISLVLRDGAPVRAVVRHRQGRRRLSLRGRQLSMAEDIELDLGATAKAAAADWCAAAVATTLGVGVLVALGGDIATAGPSPRGGWQVLVQDRPLDPAAHLSLPAGAAVATSSTQLRRWRQGDRFVHHIVDPSTGHPADSPWRTVTVVGRSCLEANTASTATIVRGPQGISWLESLGLPARLVHQDGSVRTLAGWPAEEEAA